MKAIYVLVMSILGVSCLPLRSAGASFPHGRVISLTRPFSQKRLIENDISRRSFDQAFATELQRLSAKYQEASRFLRGIGLNQNPLYISDKSEDLPSPTNFSGVSLSAARATRPHDNAIIPSLGVPSTGTAVMPIRDFIPGNLDVLYYGPVGFGTPKQELTVDIDTGSADLWIPVNCGNCQNNQLDPASSSTFTNSREKFKVYYGIGDVSGTIAEDTVSVAGLTVSNQAFGAVSSVSEDFNAYPNAGILGLAFGTIAQSKKPTFFEKLIQERQLAAPLFSLHLTRNAEYGSEVCFGCYDPSKAKGPAAWVPVRSRTYWSVQMDGLAINSTLVETKDITAAVDTGTTLIYVPDSLAAQFYKAIPGAKAAGHIGRGVYTYPCASTLAIALSFDGQQFALNTYDFNLGKVTVDSQDCVGGILALDEGFPSDLAIIGDEFLKSWYTTFDYRNGARIGFSPSVNND